MTFPHVSPAVETFRGSIVLCSFYGLHRIAQTRVLRFFRPPHTVTIAPKPNMLLPALFDRGINVKTGLSPSWRRMAVAAR